MNKFTDNSKVSKISKGKQLEQESEFDSGAIMSETNLSSSSIILSSSNVEEKTSQQKSVRELCSVISLDSGIQIDSSNISLSEELDKIQVSNDGKLEDRAYYVGDELFIQDTDGDTPLHLSIAQGNMKISKYLISHFQFYLDLFNNLYQTPLHIAVLTNQPHIVRQLVIAGAKVDFQDHAGNTPLHIASLMGNSQCVEALTFSAVLEEVEAFNLHYTPIINEKSHLYKFKSDLIHINNYEGFNCLHLAVKVGAFKVVEYFVRNCCGNINARDGKAGQTALHYCVNIQKPSALHNVLHLFKANPKIRNYANKTPMCIARTILRYKPNDITAQMIVSIFENYFKTEGSEDESNDSEEDSTDEEDYNSEEE